MAAPGGSAVQASPTCHGRPPSCAWPCSSEDLMEIQPPTFFQHTLSELWELQIMLHLRSPGSKHLSAKRRSMGQLSFKALRVCCLVHDVGVGKWGRHPYHFELVG